MNTSNRLPGAGLVALGAAVTAVATLGPLVLDVLRYRISRTSLNQIVGGDAAALAVVAPVAVAVGVLAIRGHPAAPVLALAPSIFVVYTYTQLILGNEFLRLPGNVERFFPLLLGVFILAAAIAVRAWWTFVRAPSRDTRPRSCSTSRAGRSCWVVGSRGHGAFAGMLLGSVSRHCVQHAPCPVVVVPQSPVLAE